MILTNAGGPSALASDSLSTNGFILNDLEAETREILRQNLSPAAQISNPVDMLGGAEPKDYELAVRTLVNDKNVDIVIPILVPQSLVNPTAVAQAIVMLHAEQPNGDQLHYEQRRHSWRSKACAAQQPSAHAGLSGIHRLFIEVYV